MAARPGQSTSRRVSAPGPFPTPKEMIPCPAGSSPPRGTQAARFTISGLTRTVFGSPVRRDRGAEWTTWQLARGDDLRYFPYLTARRQGELAATWFSGRGEGIKVHVATIDIPQRDFPPHFAEAPPFSPDSWEFAQKPGEPRRRDTAGEYAAIAFLRDGRLAVVTTIQDDQRKRFGFSWRTVSRSK